MIPERIKYSFSSNLASSCVPPSLAPMMNGFNLQDYRIPVENVMLRPNIYIYGLDYLQEDIKNHFEGRIASFFRQCLFVYRTYIELDSCVNADAQVGGPGNYALVANPELKVKSAAHAAHRATLPSLRSLSYSFAHNTSLHLEDNSTDWLPVEINQVDSHLDRSFRATALSILRQVSQGAINPERALYTFLEAATSSLKSFDEKDPHKFKVITSYVEVAEDCLEQMTHEEVFIRSLAGSAHPEEPLETVFLRAQYVMHRRHKVEQRFLWLNPQFKTTLPYWPVSYWNYDQVNYLFRCSIMKSHILSYVDALNNETEVIDDVNALYRQQLPERMHPLYWRMVGLLGYVPQNPGTVLCRVIALFAETQVAHAYPFVD